MTEHSLFEMVSRQIRSVAETCGRDPATISLVAVTKQVDWSRAYELYQLGQRDFGENRIQEAFAKQEEAPIDCRWHFIGHLQSNKVNKVVGRFTLIHSVNSVSLAKTLSKASEERGICTPILLQANTSGEESKQGLSALGWRKGIEEVWTLPGIEIRGLMTMAPLTADEALIRDCFRGLRTLRDELRGALADSSALSELSMGMSQDFKIAIEEGATLLRIGSALF